MTGGVAVILGKTGRNFAAGMSGGIAFVWDPEEEFSGNCNPAMISLSELDAEDKKQLKNLLKKHADYTGSKRAKKILKEFTVSTDQFVKVMPNEYRKILRERGAVPVPQVREGGEANG
jgi:glutamate synthase domain-containing protein 3